MSDVKSWYEMFHGGEINHFIRFKKNTSPGNVQGKNFGSRFVWDLWHTPSFCGIFPEFF